MGDRIHKLQLCERNDSEGMQREQRYLYLEVGVVVTVALRRMLGSIRRNAVLATEAISEPGATRWSSGFIRLEMDEYARETRSLDELTMTVLGANREVPGRSTRRLFVAVVVGSTAT